MSSDMVLWEDIHKDQKLITVSSDLYHYYQAWSDAAPGETVELRSVGAVLD